MTLLDTVAEAFDALSFDCRNGTALHLREKLDFFIESADCEEDKMKRCTILLDLAIACLKVFLIENWTGPCLDEKDIPENLKFICSKDFDESVRKEFGCNNDEGIHSLTRKPGFFYISFTILLKMSAIKHLNASRLWKLRCLSVYQNIIEENSNFVFNELISIAESEEDLTNIDSETRVQFHLECAHMYLKYYGYKKAKEHLDKAGEILGIDVKLSGAPGKRTKFQEKELAQLRIDINVSSDRALEEKQNTSAQINSLPTDVLLEDDTLLPQVKFATDEETPHLKPIEQAYTVSLCIFYQKSRPKDNLLIEELLPYVQAVLRDPQTWSIQAKALHLRSLLESQKRRTIERSMIQMERLVEEYRKGCSQDENRLYLLHCVDMSPRWMNEACFGRILMMLGCTKAALEVFERIEAWDDVIECFQKLGRLEKAENTIRRELEKCETSKLWCLLGDVTGNIEFYEKAWQFSNHRNARSQRSLGFHYLRSGKLQECIPYFQASLNVSSLQPQVWFSLGCASMATGQLDVAQTAWQRFVTIEPDSYEAWTNLANVFIKTKQKQKAFKALKEALKSNHGSWQVWENYLLVSVDIGEFKETIRSFHNLLDLKRKEVDVEILRILVGAVIKDTLDANGVPASSLKAKLLELFGRISSQVTNNAEVWLLYGDLCIATRQNEDIEKALNYYLKAHRSVIQSSNWEKNSSDLKIALEIYKKLSDTTLDIATPGKLESKDVQILSSTKMAVGNFLKRFDLVFPEGCTREYDDESKDSLKRLRDSFHQLSNLLLDS